MNECRSSVFIGHSARDCCNGDDDELEKTLGWGKSLRATPRRGVKKFMDEIEDIRACQKELFVSEPVSKKEGGSSEVHWGEMRKWMMHLRDWWIRGCPCWRN